MAEDTPVIYDFATARRLGPQAFRTPADMARLRLDAHAVGRGLAALERYRGAQNVHPSALAEPPPSFAAYAPDPDADYARGVADGRAAAYAEAEPDHNPNRWTARDHAVRLLLLVGLPAALLLVSLLWAPRA